MTGRPFQERVDERPRIWIVDDSPLQGEICRSALAPLNDVRVFGDGASMLEALAGEAPDLLVLDWNMPELSGLDLCRFVRESKDAGSLPILVLTASGVDELVEAFDAGANDFVMKPFSRIELGARVAGLVRSQNLHARLANAERRLRVEGEFRESFIGMLAHDLRQPLNTFILANDTIGSVVSASTSISATSSMSIADRLGRLVVMQGRAAQRMSRMVAELLDFARSRPESGMPIAREFMDFEPVARVVVDEMQVGHPERELRLTVSGACSGRWDRDRLAQVCSNLIGNAIEHSTRPASPIDIRLSRRDEIVELSVSNEGEPIPEALLPTLFAPYQRGRDATRVTGGVGLGLHIVSEIVRAHGGTITAESDATTTRFRVMLPVGAVASL